MRQAIFFPCPFAFVAFSTRGVQKHEKTQNTKRPRAKKLFVVSVFVSFVLIADRVFSGFLAVSLHRPAATASNNTQNNY
jgi:hypothetical protein